MLDEIKQRSLKENRWIELPWCPGFFAYGNKLVCKPCKTKRMNHGSGTQHMESKHNMDLDTGQKLMKEENLPQIPQNKVKNPEIPASIDNVKKSLTSKELFDKIIENRTNNRITSKANLEPNFASLLTKRRDVEPPETQRRRWYESLPPEYRRDFKMWGVLQKMKQMGMPQHVTDKYMIKYGFKKPETEKPKLPFVMLIELLKLIKETDDPITQFTSVCIIDQHKFI